MWLLRMMIDNKHTTIINHDPCYLSIADFDLLSHDEICITHQLTVFQEWRNQSNELLENQLVSTTGILVVKGLRVVSSGL